MLALTRHFANTDLSVTKTHNASFFNFLGSLIIYPASWDIFMIIAALAFIAFLLFKSFKEGLISGKSFGLAFLLIVGSVVIAAVLSFGLGKLLLSIYPQYEEFYAGQFYNHKWYLITCIGISILISSLLNRKSLMSEKPYSFKAAVLLFFGLLCIVFYLFIPTGTYFILFPTIALSIYYFIASRSDLGSVISAYVASIVPLAMWLPVVTIFFLAFSLVGLPMPTIHVTLIVLSTMVVFDKLWTSSGLMRYIGLAAILISIAGGHLSSNPTAEHPLPSDVFYNYNTLSGEAHIATTDKHINIGNEQYLSDAKRSQLKVPYNRTYWNVATDIQPTVVIPHVIYDSLQSNMARIINNDVAYNTRLHIPEPSNVAALYINGQEIFLDRDRDESMIIEAFAMLSDTMTIKIEKRNPTVSQTIGVNSNYATLPFNDVLPNHAIRGEGYTAITYELRF
jgi:hypothetical protein